MRANKKKTDMCGGGEDENGTNLHSKCDIYSNKCKVITNDFISRVKDYVKIKDRRNPHLNFFFACLMCAAQSRRHSDSDNLKFNKK